MGFEEIFGNKYCPNCKQNVHPQKKWLSLIIVYALVGPVALIALAGMDNTFGFPFATILLLLFMGASIILPIGTRCPICKVGWSNLEPAK